VAHATRGNEQRIRVLIVDDHDLFREGLRQLIQTDAAIEVVGEAATGAEAIERVRELHPDVVLMDISMPGVDGIRATEQIVRQFPKTHVVMLTMYQNEEYQHHAVRAGASGFLVKSVRPEQLFQAIRLAAENGARAGDEQASRLEVEASQVRLWERARPAELPHGSDHPHLRVPAEPLAHRLIESEPSWLGGEERIARLEERLRFLETQLQYLLARTVAAPAPPAETEREPAVAPPEPTDARQPAAEQIEPWQEIATGGTPSSSHAATAAPALRTATRQRLARVGAMVLALGAAGTGAFALVQGWVLPLHAVIGGMVTSGVLLAGSLYAFGRQARRLGHTLLITGLLTGSLAIVGGTRLFETIPAEARLAALAGLAMAAGLVASRATSELAAGVALALALSAPALLGLALSPSTVAFLLLATMLAALAAIWHDWGSLPLVVFAVVGPQLARWIIDDVSAPLGLAVSAGFWASIALPTGVAGLRSRQRRPAFWWATLLLASTGCLVWAGLSLLEHETADYRGVFLLGIALASGSLGGLAWRAGGDRHPVTLATGGTAVAALALLFPLALDGPLVMAGWAALAVALAWVYDERRHGIAGLAAVVLAALALGHLVATGYPPQHAIAGSERQIPFTGQESRALAALLGAFLVAGVFVRSLPIRSCLAATALSLVSYVLPFETSGGALTAGWASVFVLTVALERRTRLGTSWRARFGVPSPLFLPMTASAVLAVLHAFSTALSPGRLGFALLPDTPPSGEPLLAAGVLIATVLTAGWLARHARARQLASMAAILVTAYVLPSELPDAPLVLSWAALAIALSCVLRGRCT
jgi:DNA-binding NarL/FixJ family response regulator